jgi:hypothetical protein
MSFDSENRGEPSAARGRNPNLSRVVRIAARSLFGDHIPMYPRYHTSTHYGEFTLVRDVNAALGIAWRNRFVTVNAAQPNESMAA